MEYSANVLSMIKFLSDKKISSLVEILKKNPYEKIVPFNLWFNHNKVTIKIIKQNDQLIRLRYYDNHLLTPIVTESDVNMLPIRKFIDDMTVYQPYYPESYYDMWEILHMFNMKELSKSLFIINEESHGSIESVLMYKEKNLSINKTDIADVWFTGGEIFNLLKNDYSLNVPMDKVLSQTYNFNYVKSTSELNKYNIVMINSLHKLDNLTVWSSEPIDIICNIFYLIRSLKQLEASGKLIIKLNAFGRKYWDIIVNIIEQFFPLVNFFKPTIHNPYNPCIYLIANNYIPNPVLLDIVSVELEYQYRLKNYKNIIFTHKFKKNNLISKYYSFIDSIFANLKLYDNQIIKITNKYKIPGQIIISKLVKNFNLEILSVKSSASKTTLKNVILLPKLKLSDQELGVDVSYELLCGKKSELNYTKRVMDTKPNGLFQKFGKIRQTDFLLWEKFTEKFYPLGNIIYSLRSKFSAQFVTNAWMKLYEILSYNWKGVFSKYTCVNAFHICEAPGAFISASNHIFRTNNITYNWHAQTLHQSANSLALEDRFGLIAKYPNKWLYGPSDSNNRSGDITCSSNIKYYKEKLGSDINFITADGGFYCEPSMLNMQEEIVAKIIFGEIITIFACLSNGGNAILKMFLPLSCPLTVSMIYLMHRYFESVTYSKPISSGASNSEIYVLLQNYQKISETQLNILYEMLDDQKITHEFFIVEMTNGFIQKYYRDVSDIIDRQINALQYMYYYYYNQSIKIPESTYTQNNWFVDNPIKQIHNEMKL